MGLELDVAKLVDLIDSDDLVYDQLFSRVVDQGLQDGIGYVSRQSLHDLLKTIILPANSKRDRGWQDYAQASPGEQPGVETMNKVSIDTMRTYFDSLFITTQVDQVSSIAQQINQYSWHNSDEDSSLMLFTLCGSDRISNLYYLAVAAAPVSQYALRVMTVDPCAGYLLAQWTFESSPQDGSYFGNSGLANLQTPTGAPNPFPSSYATSWTANPQVVVEGGGAQFSKKAIELRTSWIENLTNPVDTNPIGFLQQEWKQRLNQSSDSQVATLIKINQQFNLNVNQLYQRSIQEDQQLKQLGLTYQSIAETNSAEPSIGSTSGTPTTLDQVLSIRNGGSGKVNSYGGSQLILNSDRIILNTRSDYLMLFGAAGVMISSPNAINLDSDSTITLFAEDGLFLGVPNKGNPVASKTNDQEYEPLVLGNKLVSLVEDLILTLRNASVLSPTGASFFAEETLDQLAKIQSKLPEIVSTYAFVDGHSHEVGDQPAGADSSTHTQEANQQQTSTPDPNRSAPVVTEGESATTTTPLTELDDYYVTHPLYNDPI